MRDTIQGLAWYARRSNAVAEIGPFYHEALGLPLLRPGPPAVYVLWGGEAVAFEVIPGGTPPPAYRDPAEAATIPIFRSHGLDALLNRLTVGGGRILVDRVEPSGRTAYILDPLGNLTGLREANPSSTESHEAEAARRWKVGETRLPGADAMRANIQDLGWIVMYVVDVDRQVAFYRDVVGLDVVSTDGAYGVTLSLGDTALLEIRPGGQLQPIPKVDRFEISEALLLRLHDVSGLVDDLRRHGAHFVHEPFVGPTGGVVVYFVDPEGRLVGVQDHPRYPEWLEEREAWRRWDALHAES